MKIKTFDLGNPQAIQQFCCNYERWGLWYNDPKMNAAYYKCVLPNDVQIIAHKIGNGNNTDTTYYMEFDGEISQIFFVYWFYPLLENCARKYGPQIDVQCDFSEPTTIYEHIKSHITIEQLAKLLLSADYCVYCDYFNAECHCEFFETCPDQPLYNGCERAALKYLNSYTDADRGDCENEITLS